MKIAVGAASATLIGYAGGLIVGVVASYMNQPVYFENVFGELPFSAALLLKSLAGKIR